MSRAAPKANAAGRRPEVSRWTARWLAAVCLWLLALACTPAGAAGAGGFDHASTGFPLQAAHENVRCETCHQKGIFKGTPRDCAGCHVANNTRAALAPPSRHIPTRQACDSCHTTASFAGAIFTHVGVAPGACASCHNNVFAQGKGPGHMVASSACDQCHGISTFASALNIPGNHIPTAAGAQCASCHKVSDFSVTPALSDIHANAPGGGRNCSQCHGANAGFFSIPEAGFTIVAQPPRHVPTGAACESCHVGPGSSIAALPVVDGARFSNSAFSHAGITTNCDVCHGASVGPGTFVGVTPKTQAGLALPHLPTSASCEACHANAIPAMLIPPAGAQAVGGTTFAGGLMSHAGIGTGCAACHGPGLGRSFMGVASLVTMPPTSPMGPSSHIPSSTQCESCHLGSVPAGVVPANAAKAPPGTGFATPAPTSAQIHAGVTGNCASCHDSSFVWMGVGAYPISPTVVTAGAQYTGFQTRPRPAAGAYNVADAAHPAAGDCSQCHSGTAFFSATDKPANHIPTAATAQCASCHVSGDFAVIPSITNIHANAPSMGSNCAQCHGAAAASFAIPAVGFSIVGLPDKHLPTSAGCEACHVGPGSSVAAVPVTDGAKFANSKFNHAGAPSSCESCHGPSIGSGSFAGIASIVTMPPTSPMGPGSHIPSSTRCESCHLGSVPSGQVAANAAHAAPGSGFAVPAPTSAQIHAGVTGNCASCHDTSFVWMGVSAYPISPSVLTSGAEYTGFQTRPRAAAGAFNVADAAHPATGECSQCHSGFNFFSAADKPANHIPTSAAAQCSSCHTSTDFSVMPTLTNIHANAPSQTANCAQCHGAAAASFAIPAAGFSIVGQPANHLPTTASCESCHVGPGSSIAATPVTDGAKFSNSKFSHAGLSGNCVACHGPSVSASSFAGITSIVTMPATSPMGPTAHIPSSTACETCHLGSMPAGQVAANAAKAPPGTLFAAPAPTTAQIHTGVTGNCASCHDSSFVWMGMGAYPISPAAVTPGAQYTGFQTRPRAAAGPFNVADAAHPATGDCSQCHSGFNYFTATDKPANHIPTAASAQCASCHTSSDYAVIPTLTNIHANAPSQTGNCAQCHGAAAPGFAIPSAGFSIVGLPANHVPTTAACESCHVGPGSSIPATPVKDGARFANSKFSHAGISGNCVACHGPAISGSSFAGIASIVTMPATTPMGPNSHIPSSTQCETCHAGSMPAGQIAANAAKAPPGTLFATPAPTTTQIHSGISGRCASCHDSSFVWMGMGAYPISPAVLTPGAQYTGFQTRPRAAAGPYNVADAAHPATGDCSQCHSGFNYFTATDKPANHIPTAASAQCSACHTSADYAVIPTLTNIHANAPSQTGNCAQCHGAAAPTFAIPAAGFSIVGLPANHVPTTAACESCHVGPGSSIPATPVKDGATFANSKFSHAGISGNCAACHGPAITGSSFAGIASIVTMPATAPVGANAHIPSSTACEACHLGSMPSGQIAANAAKDLPGTAFATPAPTSAQIHAGISGNCSNCHDTGFVWMDMARYPISPAVITPGAQYTGFQTRPRAAAGTFNVADPAHPASGDCSQCHSGTSYFSGMAKPAGHMPTPVNACSTCHVVPGDFSIAGLTASLPTLHTGITSGCISCHTAGAGAGPFAGCTTQAACPPTPPLTYQPKTMPLAAGGTPDAPSPQTHVPATGVACEKCHSPTNFTSFAGMNMRSNAPAHNAVHPPATCESCHEYPYKWFGVTIQTPGPPPHHGRTPGQDCISSGCHKLNYTEFQTAARVRPVMRAAVTLSSPRLLPDGTPLPGQGPAGAFSHRGVLPGQCQSCHNGQAARGLPPRHLATRASCDSCHRSTAWTPAQFNHQGTLAGQCASCHNGAQASGKPAAHFVTARSCDACHRSIAWVPVSYSHLSPAYHAAPDKTRCTSCHLTNGEIVPRQMRGGPRPRPVPPGP